MGKYPPKIIYKYRPWKLDSPEERYRFSRMILEERKIFLAKASQFNDPFDVSIEADYSLLSKEDWKKRFDELRAFSISQGIDLVQIDSQIKRKLDESKAIWYDRQELQEMSFKLHRECYLNSV